MDKVPQVLKGVSEYLLVVDVVKQVGAEAAGFKDGDGRLHSQALLDILLHTRCCGCRQSDAGSGSKALPEVSQLEVIRSEVVAPLGDTVSLVDGDPGHTPSLLQGGEEGTEALCGGQLRRDVEQPHTRPAALEVREDPLSVGGRRLGVEGLGPDVPGPQRLHLVLDEGQEGGEDQRDPAREQRWQLVAQRLAGPRRHGDKDIAGT